MNKKTIIKIFIFLAIACVGFFYTQEAIAQEFININTATPEELDSLPGIGASKAQAIIDYRVLNGQFQTIEEIMNVSGIGEATYENIKYLINVGDVQPIEENKLSEDVMVELIDTSSQAPQDDKNNVGDVVINEFVSDPTDDDFEWIELYNTTDQFIDLTGWYIEEGSGAKTILDGEIDNFFVTVKPKGNLNNNGDIIILRDKSGDIINEVAYGDWDDGDISDNAPVAGDPKSTARVVDGQNSNNNKNDFAITDMPTMNQGNVVYIAETEEVGDLGLVISEILPNPFGIDADGEFIELYNASEEQINLLDWRLENKIKSKYEFGEEKIIGSGEYFVLYREESDLVLNNKSDSVKLFKPEGARALQSVKFKKAEEGFSYNYSDDEWLWSEEVTPGKENKLPIINILPDVALYHPDKALVGTTVIFDASDTVDEDGDELKFSWDFGDGFKNNLQNPAHTFLKEGEYNISLAVNDGKEEEIKKVVIKIVSDFNDSYEKKFISDNLFNESEEYIEILESKNYYSGPEVILMPTITTIEGAKNFNVGDLVLVNGVVTVLPEVLGTQYFYISEGDSGIQVYNYKKDFPDLRTGDYVEVVGELSKASGEMRIKTSQKENIINLGHKKEQVALGVDCEKVYDSLVGGLIKVNGEIVERKSSTIYLDDGTGEVKIYIKTSTGINPKNYEEGSMVEITGILGRTKTGLRIMPRSEDDILIKKTESQTDNKGVVLGETAEGDEWTIEARDKKAELFKYLLVVAGGLIVLLGGLLIKVSYKR